MWMPIISALVYIICEKWTSANVYPKKGNKQAWENYEAWVWMTVFTATILKRQSAFYGPILPKGYVGGTCFLLAQAASN